jgi:hypothetical protein
MTEIDEPLTPDAERARAALAALREPPPARDELRARLKREFAAGTLAPPAPQPVAPSDARPAPRPIARVPRRRAPVWQWAVAAAAALIVVAGVRTLNHGPAWRLAAATGEGIATVDGRPIPLTHHDELAAALVPGARVRVPAGCQIELASAGTMAIQMTPETDATVPPVPGRWFARSVAGEIQSGEWRITTGPAFHGAHLAVATPQAHVMVTERRSRSSASRPARACACGRARCASAATAVTW